MTIDTKRSLVDYEGQPLKTGDKNLTVGLVLVATLSYEDDQMKMSPEQKIRSYNLSSKIVTEKTVDLEAEDIVFIKERAAKMYAPIVYGQLCEILSV